MHVSDGYRTGAAGLPPDTRPVLDQQSVTNGSRSFGAPTSPTFVYDVVPLTLQKNNIATAQTLSGASATLAAGTGVTSTTLRNGTTVLALDCARAVTISGAATTVVATTLTVSGYDDYEQPMSQVLTGPTGTAAVTTTKAFRYVSSVAASTNTVSNISIGTSDTIGLPVRADAFEYVTVKYNSALVTSSTGFTAAVTSTATTTSGDVRGTYALQTASNGSRRLVIETFVKNTETVDGVWGVTQA